MIGKKFYKDNYSAEEYAQAAEWCNNNGCMIQEFDDYYEVVELPKPDLSEYKEMKILELKGIRDQKEVEDILVNNNLFDYDEKARERISAAIIALDLTQGTITWTLADNTNVEVTSSDLKYVVAMVAQRSNALHVKYRELKEQVESAQTKEEVESVTWDD